MKRGILLLTFLMFFLLVQSSYAEIIINGINEVYNAGDYVNASVSIRKQASTGDYLEAYLDCGGRILVHKKYYKVAENEKKDLSIDFPTSLNGECNLEILFDGEKVESKQFEISNLVNVDYSLNNLLFFPSEKLIVNGVAKKDNGANLAGFIRVYLEGVENKTIEVKNGTFSFEILLKSDLSAGEYDLLIEAFEKDGDEQIINYGKKTGKIEIKSKATSIKIESNESVKPPFTFFAKISLLDQAGEFIYNETVIVKLFSPDGGIADGKSIKSGEKFAYYFLSNSSRESFWYLRTYYGGIFSEKQILIEENKDIFVLLINSSEGNYAVIKNIGNVNYSGNVFLSASSSIGEKNISIPVVLELEGEMEYPIELEGLQNVTVDGKNHYALYFPAKTPTFAAVSINPQISIMSYLYFLIIILALVAAYFLIKALNKFRKRNKTGEKDEDKEETEMREGGKFAFMIFFRFGKYVEEAREIVEKNNLTLTKLSDNLYYVFFYSETSKDPEMFSYNLARKIRNKAMSKGQEVSIVINSGNFIDKEKFLKEFSLVTRKMVDHAQGGILFSEQIFKKTKVRAEKSMVFKENGKTYRMYKV